MAPAMHRKLLLATALTALLSAPAAAFDGKSDFVAPPGSLRSYGPSAAEGREMERPGQATDASQSRSSGDGAPQVLPARQEPEATAVESVVSGEQEQRSQEPVRPTPPSLTQRDRSSEEPPRDTRPDPDGLIVQGPGQAAHDGQTLRAGSQLIRLDVLHAPAPHAVCGTYASSWNCGKAARKRLARLVDGMALRCRGRAWTQDALIARCFLPDGSDVGSVMVRDGLAAVNRTHFSDYASEEAEARAERRGLWSGPFTAPWRE